MAEVKAPSRPLSPHLQIYGWTWTFVMSGFHRATGFAIYLGSVIPVFWLVCLALGKGPYDFATWILGTWWFGIPVLIAYSWGIIHHTLGGIRHFVWDFCYGFETKERFFMAKATLAGSVILTVLLWIAVFIAR